MPYVTMGFPKGLTTIDHTRDGFLEPARDQGRGTFGEHRTVSEVFQSLQVLDRLASNRKGVVVNVIGHGDGGVIVTGNGEHKGSHRTFMGRENKSDWVGLWAALRDAVDLKAVNFWGCHVGADWAGAAFLYDVACIVRVPVSGPTGFILSDPTFTWELPSKWAPATYDRTPTIEPPANKYTSTLKVRDIYFRDKRGGRFRVDIAHVLSMRFYSGAGESKKLEIKENELKLIELMTTAVAQFDEPFSLPGAPAAIATATVEIEYEELNSEGHWHTVIREFTVLNNLLLRDNGVPGTYYFAFKDHIESLMRSRS